MERMTERASSGLALRQPIEAKRRLRSLLSWSIPLILALAVLVAFDRLAQNGAAHWALSQVRAEAEAVAALRVALLRSEIEKQRTLPVVLGQDPDVRSALLTGDRQRLAGLNVKLDTLSAGTRTAVIYLLDSAGRTIAASNWQTPTSFIGNNYSFRSYFREHAPGFQLLCERDGIEEVVRRVVALVAQTYRHVRRIAVEVGER